MIIRPYGSEKFDKLGFETFYGAINIKIKWTYKKSRPDDFVKRPRSGFYNL